VAYSGKSVMAGSGRSSPLHLPHPFSSIVMTTPRVGFSRQLWGLELLWKPNSFEKILYLASEDDTVPYLTLKIFFSQYSIGFIFGSLYSTAVIFGL
jgi:hypothetical protein